MTGILIYSVRPVFSHSPLSQANVKPFHSKPTLVTSTLEHDIMHLPKGRRESSKQHLTQGGHVQIQTLEICALEMQAGAGEAEHSDACCLCNGEDD